ncbi:Lar family restriction alleviation protein [Xenorhabdus bovienii]|uniref:Lar family restriction alleviation protein n=1 Tax=Xenorhabdus bovienii TaxID=40576 RepID=UPI0023B2EB63|nr:Lar family restriction alleviation protein [Xenorhabdus bovienii]MDE9536913.1 Lar family restriction alleviation protein [Xenorhabdus bovienii]MDE9589918.1 Lar family restriction alleviation protein [Xenorhabdus bovienii]
MTKLKPCPFCGEEADVAEEYGGRYYVYCSECLVEQTEPSETKEEAITIWNQRANNGG